MVCTTGENFIHPAAVECDYNLVWGECNNKQLSSVPLSIDTVSHQTAAIA